MTKADIVNEISRTTGIEKAAVQTTVEAFMEAIKGSVIDGKNVYLRGFGSFVVKKRAEKTARNISKNVTIKIPAPLFPTSLYLACTSFKLVTTKLSLSMIGNKSRIITRWHWDYFFSPKLFRNL